MYIICILYVFYMYFICILYHYTIMSKYVVRTTRNAQYCTYEPLFVAMAYRH